MNLCVLHENSRIAAQMLCDSHLRKMCTETAQILTGVLLRRNITPPEGMPKPQNINHPVIVAAAETSAGLDWVLNYNYDLHIEYMKRFSKEHACRKWMLEYINILWNKSDGECIYLAKCCGDLDVKDLDIVSAYKKYYVEVKKPQLEAKKLWKFTNQKDWTNGEKTC